MQEPTRTITKRKDRGHWIIVEGARTNNLKNVSVRIPKHRMTVLTGVSGSGKSSLAFGTIASEAQRLVSETYPSFIRNRIPQGRPAQANRIDGLTFTTVVDQRPFSGNARSTVGTASDIAPLVRLLFSRIAVPSAGFSQAYSFNHPDGMCPTCEGLGVTDNIDIELLLNLDLSLNEGAILFPAFAPGTYRWSRMVLSGLVDPDTPLRDVPSEALHQLLYAEGLKLTNPAPGYVKSKIFDGIIPRIRNSYLRNDHKRTTEETAALERIITRATCTDCSGSRLNEAARNSLIEDLSIVDWMDMPLTELRRTVANINNADVAPLLTAMRERLDAIEEVGLGYLSLSRESTTLSGGEAQRIKVIRYLGSALSDVCYVFDEPSAGLHPHDVHRLLRLLKKLRDAHNTIIVVEHNKAVIDAADHVVDLGPGAGISGGTILFEGTPQELHNTDTATGRTMHDRLQLKNHPRIPSDFITIRNATANNLQEVTVDIPLRVLTAVSGVAGSGKSSLFSSVLPQQYPDFTVIDQRPLRGSTRSTPATILGIADPLRSALAKVSGLVPSWFSSNGKGACPICKGRGIIVTDLAFLDDVHTMCEACQGSRFNDTALAATLAGHNIADILAMNASRAKDSLSDFPEITKRLSWLEQVGLGYLSIGQSTHSLSGGERQRLQLARTLIEVNDPTSLRLILDEPTSGLHSDDVTKLLHLFDYLVDASATIIAIEHDLQVVASADYVIDIGPGAGSAGGKVIYTGPPLGLLDAKESLTAQYVQEATR